MYTLILSAFFDNIPNFACWQMILNIGNKDKCIFIASLEERKRENEL